MVLHKEKIASAITLSTIETNKFKSAVISFSLNIPLKKKDYAYNLLLSHLMQRGTAKYPSNALLNKKLDELYGAYVEIKSHRISDVGICSTSSLFYHLFGWLYLRKQYAKYWNSDEK